jgi:hypothetical protein
MPKAPIEEHRNAGPRESDVRRAPQSWDHRFLDPKSQTHAME